jgi:hypothetical protein
MQEVTRFARRKRRARLNIAQGENKNNSHVGTQRRDRMIGTRWVFAPNHRVSSTLQRQRFLGEYNTTRRFSERPKEIITTHEFIKRKIKIEIQKK